MKNILKNTLGNLLLLLIMIALSFIMISAVGSSQSQALSAFFISIFGSVYGLSEVFVRAIPLTLAALGVSVGFRTGFFNIGAEGQIYMGACAATAAGMALPGLPPFLMIPLVLTAAFLAAGGWSLIPGFLKARFGLSEVIMTIMFNYIAINLTGILVRTVLKDPSYALPMSPEIPDAMKFSSLLFPTRLHGGLFLALGAAILVYIILWKTAFGFRLRAVGENPRAAKCTGISVYVHLLAAALISGGLAGLAGAGEVMGLHFKLMDGITPNFGYLAIIIALLGKNHPFWIIISSLGISALHVGSSAMQRQAGVPSSISWIIMGALVLLILAKEQILIRLNERSES